MAWKAVNRRWSQFRELSGRERWLLVQSLVLLPVIGVSLRLAGFRRCYSLLHRLAGRQQVTDARTPESNQWDLARSIARLVDVAARHGPYRATCLPRSLTLWWLLQRRAIPASLRIGVQKQADTMLAHAWVELTDRVLNDRQDVAQRYAPFAATEDSWIR